MHSTRLEHKQSTDLHFAHAVIKIDGEFRHQLSSLGWVIDIESFHLLHTIQRAAYQDENGRIKNIELDVS